MGLPTNVANVHIDGDPGAMSVKSLQEYESFFMKFGGLIQAKGFVIQEKTISNEEVAMPYQVVWRWKKPDSTSPIIQLGIGVLTINGSPPDYTNWDSFSQTIKPVIEALIESFDTCPDGKPETSSQTLLRYIDRFDSNLTNDVGALRFMNDILDIQLNLPDAITKKSSAPEAISPMLRLNVPIENGDLSLIFANAVVSGKQGFLLDTTAANNASHPFDVDSLYNALDASHTITNSVFMDLTKKIHTAMGITE